MVNLPARFTTAPSTDMATMEEALNSNLRTGLRLVLFLVFGLGGLAAFVPMGSAVIGAGEVTVESHVKQIGHPTGGVIADVLVRNGDHVKAGQILMRLDTTVSGASARMTGENVNQLLARQARLLAERDDMPGISFPPSLTAQAGNPAVAALMQEEQRNFALRRQSQNSQIQALSQRAAQAEQEIAGYETQITAYNDQAKLIDQELVAARGLYAQKYTTLERLNSLERAAVSLRGNIGSTRTSAAQARAHIAEIRQQMASLRESARSESGTELSAVQAQLSELMRNKVAADDTNTKNVIRAPSAGIIDKLNFTTIGGVVPPGQTLMEIIPDQDEMIVETRLPTSDIDDVHAQQPAGLRFSAFNTRTTPEIDGFVTNVSADRHVDEKSGATYYTATISIPPAELKKLGNLKLKPGMPVETFIRTGSTTMLGYIMKPLSDQLARAFRQK